PSRHDTYSFHPVMSAALHLSCGDGCAKAAAAHKTTAHMATVSTTLVGIVALLEYPTVSRCAGQAVNRKNRLMASLGWCFLPKSRVESKAGCPSAAGIRKLPQLRSPRGHRSPGYQRTTDSLPAGTS